MKPLTKFLIAVAVIILIWIFIQNNTVVLLVRKTPDSHEKPSCYKRVAPGQHQAVVGSKVNIENFDNARSGKTPEESELVANNYAEYTMKQLDPYIHDLQRESNEEKKIYKPPNSSRRIAAQQITEPSLPPGSFIGPFRPQAVPTTRDLAQDLDIPDNVLSKTNRRYY